MTLDAMLALPLPEAVELIRRHATARATIPHSEGVVLEKGQASGAYIAAPGQEPSSPAADRESALRQLEPAVRKAYLAFQYAETMNSRPLGDRAAYERLREHGIDQGKGDPGELVDYQLPAFDSWSRYLRKARNVLDEPKNTPRAGRAEKARSVVRRRDT